MANEYLTRTPTSSGNRHVFTISFWTKNNVAGGHYFQQRENANSTTQFGISHRTPEDYLRVIMNDGGSVESLNDCLAEMRDFSSWQNIIVAVNTTIALAEDRVKIYVDGVRRNEFNSDSLSDNPAQNFQTSVNDTVRALIGIQRPNSSATLNSSVTAQLTDYFLIDGQALTPDVFGFYKEGKGYQSSGTQRATDFRPGQWSPKAPRTIKSEINRKGGFGVNGFYMPMNDSSNFGADFHCDIDSIIKLKGEDLPQPRNGAPTTSDNYVSQLRSDPYASNLVLAIPGISGGQGSGYGDYSADIKGSGSNKTVTAYGNAGIAVTASYYGSAIRFDGTDDYMEVGSAGESDFNFGAGDFTVEAWMNFVSFEDSPGFGIWDGVNNERQWLIYFNNNGRPRYFTSTDGSGSINIQHNVDHTTNEWIHVAMERNGSTLSGYINGVAVGINPNLGSSSLFTTTDDKLELGRWSYTNTNDGNYFLQDLRIYKGVAKYKGGFDVPKPYTPVGIGTWRAVSDTCKNNFATLNPLDAVTDNQSGTDYTQATHSNGNLTVILSDDFSSARGSIGISTGKYYWEIRIDDNTNSPGMGVIAPGNQLTSYSAGANGASYEPRNDRFRKNGVNSYDGTDNKTDDGLIVGVALDKNVGIISFFADGTLLSNGTMTGLNALSDVHIPECFTFNDGSSVDNTYTWNFGQNPTFCGQVTAGTNADASGKGLFKYQPPTGFLALCEDNLPTPAIADPGKYFKTVLYTGDDGDSIKITSVGFKPDLVWVKKRTGGSQNHTLYDSVRGVDKRLMPNVTNGESSVTDYIRSFDENGFSIGGNNFVNDSGQDYVAWCWKAGGAAVTNTSGSLTSQVSANTTAGFSIVTYTGTASNATVGHGLGKKPSFIILKESYSPGNSYSNWQVYHSSLGATQRLQLSLSDAADTASNIWNDTEPTSDVFSIGTSGAMSENGGTYVAYCWAEIEGFSKFGKYIGNGNSDGPFVYLGFKPAWVLIKRTTTDGYYWTLFDNARKPTNPVNHTLNPDQVNAEVTDGGNGQIDFLSNGFKCRNTDGGINSDGVTYVYMAFAESPFQTANAK